jgi:hypothetical protein
MNVKTFLLISLLFAGTCISAAEPGPPIACNLRALTAQQRNQLEQTGARVISAIVTSRELSDGYSFQVDPAGAPLIEVAQWLDLWRRCCPFYEFQIDLRAADASLWLSVSGRPGVKEYIPVDVPKLASKLPK